jgi:hypothetical protein
VTAADLDRAVLEALAQLPPDANVTVTLRAGDVVRALEQRSASLPPDPANPRDAFWAMPDERCLGVQELAAALGRPTSWVRRHCSPKSGLPLLPRSRLDGAVMFKVGAVRTWLKEHDHVPTPAIMPIMRKRSTTR